MKYIILLLIIFLIFYFINNYIKFSDFEFFSNYTNPFYKDKTFCNFNKDLKKCICSYQKDSISIPFEAPNDSCNYKCIGKNEDECNSNYENINYYCKIDGKCKELKGTNQNKYISVNNCGTDRLSNQIKLPYLTKEDCEKSLNICDSYNNDNLSNSEIKKKCLENNKCGYCTNKFGEGKCVEGTAEGPLDLNNNCTVNAKDNENKYEYGNLFNKSFIM